MNTPLKMLRRHNYPFGTDERDWLNNPDDLFAKRFKNDLYWFHNFSNQIKETKCRILLAVPQYWPSFCRCLKFHVEEQQQGYLEQTCPPSMSTSPASGIIISVHNQSKTHKISRNLTIYKLLLVQLKHRDYYILQ